MWVFFIFNVVHVNIYKAKRRYVFCSYLHYYYSWFSFFNGSLSQKKFVKVIDVGIYDKLLEILKGSEKIVLAKFYSNVDKKIWKLKDKFNVVTGQTELRLVGWSFVKQYFFENFQGSRSQIFWKITWIYFLTCMDFPRNSLNQKQYLIQITIWDR